jgi:succinate dehydrogenase/fumarate reductase cytochrome b subunit
MNARAFWARKLFELCGLLPLGALLIAQLLAGGRALGTGGEARFDAAAGAGPPLGWLIAIGLPLVYHAAYGLRLLFVTRPNAGAYPSLRNWAYVLQRTSALVLLLFIAYHLYQVILYPLLHPDDPLLQRGGEVVVTTRYLRRVLASAHGGLPVEWIYRAGVAAAAFHFANGLWSLAVHWGLLVGRRAQRAASWAAAALGLALLGLGERVLSALLTGGA